MVIGDNVTIKSGVQICDGVKIEDNVFVGKNATFTNDLTPRSKVYLLRLRKQFSKGVCSIGANSTLVAGIEVGEMTLVGAGKCAN